MAALRVPAAQVRPRYSFKRQEVRPGEFEVRRPLSACHWASPYLLDAQPCVHRAWKCRVPRCPPPGGSAAWGCGCVQAVAVAAPATTASYAAYSQQAIVADVKEAVCRVADAAFDGEAPPTLRTLWPARRSGQAGRMRTAWLSCCVPTLAAPASRKPGVCAAALLPAVLAALLPSLRPVLRCRLHAAVADVVPRCAEAAYANVPGSSYELPDGK